jgi:hypothetical protein
MRSFERTIPILLNQFFIIGTCSSFMTGEGDCSQNSTDPLEEEEIYLEDVNDDVTLSPKRR